MKVDIDVSDICAELSENLTLDIDDVENICEAMEQGNWDHIDAMYKYAMEQYNSNARMPPEIEEQEG